ncbi:MAG: lipopolysaccharide biosynthesis protein, partial [Janthinobacterium lividum]
MAKTPEAGSEEAEKPARLDDRLRRVLHGGASALASRGVALVCSLISLPLTTRYLGPERYGIWVTISTTITMLGVLDLGIANSLTNRISQAYAADDAVAAQQHYSSALWMSTGIALLLGLLGFVLWPHLSIPALFHVTNPALARETSLAVAATFVFFLLGFPLNLSHRVLSGYQETQVVNYFMLLSNMLGLGVILAAVRLHLGLLGLTLAYSGTLTTFNLLLNAWLTLYRRRHVFPWPSAANFGAMRELLKSGSGFFVLQVAGLIVFNSDNLVITHYLGPANILPYNVTWKLAGLAAVLQTAIFPSLWPAYTEAYARGNYDWVRRTFWLAVRVAMGITLAAMA